MTFDLQANGIMSKLVQEHYYLRLSLALDSSVDVPPCSGLQLKAAIVQALLGLHGEVGAAIPVDVLKCSSTSPSGLEAIVRVPYSDLVRVWSALTLMASYSGAACVLTVQQVSSSLFSLAVSSRKFEFP